jgi:signal transduction histidine kinase
LLRGTTNGDNAKQLDMIEGQIAKLTGIIDDLLDVARIERERIELRKETLDLVALVHNAIDASRHLFDDRSQQLSLRLPEKPVLVFGDPVRLEQVVSNLLSNAAKYTDPGGEIAISVTRVNEEATISVRDNGIGIAPDKMPQLFEMFFQAHESLDRAEGGLGIGLSVTKRLVALHGGRVVGSSDGLGKGSEFSVYLPIPSETDGHPAPKRSQTPAAPSSTNRHRVLIVDDNTDTADAVAETAKDWGHTVAVAHDGAAALELSASFRPDIALVDIGLPQMNG